MVNAMMGGSYGRDYSVLRGAMEPEPATEPRSPVQHAGDALDALKSARRRLQRGLMPTLKGGVGAQSDAIKGDVNVWRFSEAQIRKMLRLEASDEVYWELLHRLVTRSASNDDAERAYQGVMTFEGMSIYRVRGGSDTPPWKLIDASQHA